MIFDGRSLTEIADWEIHLLGQEHMGERQHLEFKATVELKDADDKPEALGDIASLASGGPPPFP